MRSLQENAFVNTSPAKEAKLLETVKDGVAGKPNETVGMQDRVTECIPDAIAEQTEEVRNDARRGEDPASPQGRRRKNASQAHETKRPKRSFCDGTRFTVAVAKQRNKRNVAYQVPLAGGE